MQYRKICIATLIACLQLPALFLESYASSSSSAHAVGSNGLDPFVQAAPLIVAAVASDGIALLALHSNFAEEPLILDSDITSDPLSTPSTTSSNDDQPRVGDLPRNYRGPFRIHSVDSLGSGLLATGWRTHCDAMTDICRKLAKDQWNQFGPPNTCYPEEYGQYLASETSFRMAWSDVCQKQPLRSVGMLACARDFGSSKSHTRGTDTRTCTASPGCIWLMDATGAYQVVKGYAVGSGELAGRVNQRLLQMDLESLTVEETLRQLASFLSEQELPKDTRVELAVVQPGAKPGVRRHLVSRLWGVGQEVA